MQSMFYQLLPGTNSYYYWRAEIQHSVVVRTLFFTSTSIANTQSIPTCLYYLSYGTNWVWKRPRESFGDCKKKFIFICVFVFHVPYKYSRAKVTRLVYPLKHIYKCYSTFGSGFPRGQAIQINALHTADHQFVNVMIKFVTNLLFFPFENLKFSRENFIWKTNYRNYFYDDTTRLVWKLNVFVIFSKYSKKQTIKHTWNTQMCVKNIFQN